MRRHDFSHQVTITSVVAVYTAGYLLVSAIGVLGGFRVDGGFALVTAISQALAMTLYLVLWAVSDGVLARPSGRPAASLAYASAARR